MFKKILILLIALFSISAPLSANSDVKIDDLTIIVNSCDKYKDCWKPFCMLLHRYWPGLTAHNKNIEVILIVNEEKFSFPGITVLNTGPDKSWSDNMLQALARARTNKILYLQEDYFFNSAVNESLLKSYIERLDDGITGYTQITREPFFDDAPRHPVYKDSVIKPRFTIYRTSLQPALWQKELFMRMIKPGENPWAFEIDGSIRSDGAKLDFLSVVDAFPFTFFNACAGGFWQKGVRSFLKGKGLTFEEGSLPLVADYPLSYKVRSRVPKIFPYWKAVMGLFDPKFS